MTKAGYKAVDVTIWTALGCLSEVATILTRKAAGEVFTLSLTLALSLIVMLRHGFWSVIPAVFGGITYCLVSQAAPEYYLVYGAGNAFILLNLVWFCSKKALKAARENIFCLAAFALTAFTAVNIGRVLLAIPFGGSFLDTLGTFFLADTLNVVFAVIILIITKRQALLKNQTEFLEENACELSLDNASGASPAFDIAGAEEEQSGATASDAGQEQILEKAASAERNDQAIPDTERKERTITG